jgi:hypothetical protein
MRWETVSAAPPARRHPTKCRFRAQTLCAQLRAASSEASQSCRMRLPPTLLQGPLPRSAGAVSHTPRATSSAGTQLLRCQYLHFCTVKPSKLSTGSNTWRWHVAAVTSAKSLYFGATPAPPATALLLDDAPAAISHTKLNLAAARSRQYLYL